MKKLLFSSLVVLLLASLSSADESVMKKSLFNIAGNVSDSNGHTLSSSIGEMVIGQSSAEMVLQAGYFNEFVIPIPTATVTPTITPTLIPTATPLQGFDGKYIAKKYTYTAPNPVRGRYANFNVRVQQACTVEVLVYTTSNQFVMSFNIDCSGEGLYQKQVFMGNLANGVYLFLVRAKVNGVEKERLVKKIALIK